MIPTKLLKERLLMMPWYITVLTSIGTSIITCVGMEKYHQLVARSPRSMGDYDEGME